MPDLIEPIHMLTGMTLLAKWTKGFSEPMPKGGPGLDDDLLFIRRLLLANPTHLAPYWLSGLRLMFATCRKAAPPGRVAEHLEAAAKAYGTILQMSPEVISELNYQNNLH